MSIQAIATAHAPAKEIWGTVDAFRLSRRVNGCTAATLRAYTANLGRFSGFVGDASVNSVKMLTVQTYLSGLRGRMAPVSVHQHYRKLRTFFRWATEAGLVAADPMRGITMKNPKTLPRVPEDETIRKLLGACSGTFEGRRNRALIALLADSGVRISEALRLRIEDVNFSTRTIAVRGGKGQKDGMAMCGAKAVRALRAYLAVRHDAHPEDLLFVNRGGQPLTRDWDTHIVHRPSRRAGLPRVVGPHQLRHYSATSVLRTSGDLELTRQVLRHESLTMTLRYAHLARPDLLKKFRRASPLDNLVAGR